MLYRYSQAELSRSRLLRMLGLALVMETLTLVGDIRMQEPIWVQWLTARFAAYIVFIVVYALRYRVTNPALCYLGLISYAIYLIHPFVFRFFPDTIDPWPILCFWLAILFLIASATYRWIERPGIRLGHRPTHPGAPMAAHNPNHWN